MEKKKEKKLKTNKNSLKGGKTKIKKDVWTPESRRARKEIFLPSDGKPN